MTRPAGTTPARGFPYPGSDLVIANIPGALKSLAEAISGNLSGIGGGIVLDYYHAVLQVTTNKMPFNRAAAFPNLAAVYGMVASQSSANPANMYLYGGLDTEFLYITGLSSTIARYTGPMTIDAIGWGPPK